MAVDSNGHQWSDYNYMPGHVSIMGKDQMVAVPLGAATSEFPNNSALQHDIQGS
jgi:hypothetical protein